jgi:hypothetical protein
MKPIRILSLATLALAAACAQSPTAARTAGAPVRDGTNYNGSGNVTDGGVGGLGSGHYLAVTGTPRLPGAARRTVPFAPRFDDAGTVLPPDTAHRGTNYGGSGN